MITMFVGLRDYTKSPIALTSIQTQYNISPRQCLGSIVYEVRRLKVKFKVTRHHKM